VAFFLSINGFFGFTMVEKTLKVCGLPTIELQFIIAAESRSEYRSRSKTDLTVALPTYGYLPNKQRNQKANHSSKNSLGQKKPPPWRIFYRLFPRTTKMLL
jgi:hypothetical protein